LAYRDRELDWREGVVDWIYLAQVRDKLRPSIKNTVTNIWVAKCGLIFFYLMKLTAEEEICFLQIVN